MNIEIKKLSADMLDDWLQFFDHAAFTDNDKWAGCYCMCHHWNGSLQEEKEWDCSGTGAERNRNLAIRFINEGTMQGYLAYSGGKVTGWCNANDKHIYDSVITGLPWENSEKGKKIKAVVCFCIAPDSRGKKVASRLLERVCSDAAEDGYEYVESYPFNYNAENACTGPAAMYEKYGFKACGNVGDFITVFRKCLPIGI